MSAPESFKLEDLDWMVRVCGGCCVEYFRSGIAGFEKARIDWSWFVFAYKADVRRVLFAVAPEVRTVAFHVATVEGMTELELAFLAGMVIGRGLANGNAGEDKAGADNPAE